MSNINSLSSASSSSVISSRESLTSHANVTLGRPVVQINSPEETGPAQRIFDSQRSQLEKNSNLADTAKEKDPANETLWEKTKRKARDLKDIVAEKAAQTKQVINQHRTAALASFIALVVLSIAAVIYSRSGNVPPVPPQGPQPTPPTSGAAPATSSSTGSAETSAPTQTPHNQAAGTASTAASSSGSTPEQSPVNGGTDAPLTEPSADPASEPQIAKLQPSSKRITSDFANLLAPFSANGTIPICPAPKPTLLQRPSNNLHVTDLCLAPARNSSQCSLFQEHWITNPEQLVPSKNGRLLLKNPEQVYSPNISCISSPQPNALSPSFDIACMPAATLIKEMIGKIGEFLDNSCPEGFGNAEGRFAIKRFSSQPQAAPLPSKPHERWITRPEQFNPDFAVTAGGLTTAAPLTKERNGHLNYVWSRSLKNIKNQLTLVASTASSVFSSFITGASHGARVTIGAFSSAGSSIWKVVKKNPQLVGVFGKLTLFGATLGIFTHSMRKVRNK